MITTKGWVNEDEANAFMLRNIGLSMTTIMTDACHKIDVWDHVIFVWHERYLVRCERYLDVCVICHHDTGAGLFDVGIIKHYKDPLYAPTRMKK